MLWARRKKTPEGVSSLTGLTPSERRMVRAHSIHLAPLQEHAGRLVGPVQAADRHLFVCEFPHVTESLRCLTPLPHRAAPKCRIASRPAIHTSLSSQNDGGSAPSGRCARRPRTAASCSETSRFEESLK